MMHDRKYIAVLALLGVITALSGILGNIASGALPEAWRPYLWLAWPLFALLVVLGTGLAIVQTHIERQKSNIPQQPHLMQPSPSLLQSDSKSVETRSPANDRLAQEQSVESVTYSHLHHVLKEDWDGAPDAGVFYGRNEELDKLAQWIVTDRCRLVGIFGIGGIGKTSLAAKLAEQIKNEFEYIFWRSLQNAPPLESVLRECIQFVSDQQQTDPPKDVNGQIALLIEYLRGHRCLLILDNVESVLQVSDRAGYSQEGYEGYGRLIQHIAEVKHQSCLLLASREKPQEVTRLEGKTSPARSLVLSGLGQGDAQEILKDQGLFGPNEAWATLIHLYSGNPLALKLVSEPIRDLFGGDVSEFLKEGETVIGNVYDLLNQQFKRLSELERAVMYWLAIERELVSLDDLREDIAHPVQKRVLLEALESLHRRSMIEIRGKARFTLQPVILEYMTNAFMERVYEEINTETILLLASHALLKAQAKDYVRESQVRLILKPIAEQLVTTLGEEKSEQKLRTILSMLHEANSQKHIYTAGNLLNLLIQMKSNLGGYDFSGLIVRQAYLQGVALPDVNFAHANLAMSIFTETFSSILSLALSPNGELLAAGTTNSEIRLWQATSGTPLLTLEGHPTWIWTIAFSPDGRLLASGSDDQTIRLWEVSTGQCLKVLRGHTSWVRSVAFSPDGQFLASGSEDQTIRLWEVSTGRCLKALEGHASSVRSVAFSLGGQFLASGSEDQTARLWEVSTGQCLKVLQGHTNRVRSVAFSPDGQFLASGSEDQTIRLWEVSTGQCFKSLQGHTSWIWSVAFSPDGQFLASGSEDQTIRLWEVSTGQCLKVLRGHTNRVRSVAFSPDGQFLASGSEDQTARLWEVSTGQCFKSLQGYTNEIWSVTFSPGGRLLASGSEDQTVHLWEVSTGQCLKVLQGHTNRVRSVAFSPDGQFLASGSEDQTIRLWEVSTGQCLKVLHEHTDRIWSVAFSPDGRLLASSGEDQTVRLWEVSTGQCLKVFQGYAKIRSVTFSPGGRLLASGSDDQTVHLWEVSTGESLSAWQRDTGPIWSVTFGPDGRLLASGSEDQTAQLWEVSTGQCLKVLRGHTGRARSVAFSPDGQFLASGSDDQTVRLWEVSTGQCLKVFQGHTGPIWTIAFHPSGSISASGSNDGTIKFWDAKMSGCQKTLRSDRPYERMNITDVRGLTEAQKTMLKALGAIDKSDRL